VRCGANCPSRPMPMWMLYEATVTRSCAMTR
jgi:hypothetical protein